MLHGLLPLDREADVVVPLVPDEALEAVLLGEAADQALAEKEIADYKYIVGTIGLAAQIIVGAKSGKSVAIQFGRVENQTYHTFRHIDDAGFDRNVVQHKIVRDISNVADNMPVGLHKGSVIVDGKRLDYQAYKLPDGTINVGRITLPKK